jgi:hypothetical protein
MSSGFNEQSIKEKLALYSALVSALKKTNEALYEIAPKHIAIDNFKQIEYYHLYQSNNYLLLKVKEIEQ